MPAFRRTAAAAPRPATTERVVRADRADRVYRDLAQRIEARIHAGEFADARLPSERELALQYQASRASVRAALMLLRSMGLVSFEHKARARLRAPDSGELIAQLSGAARQFMATREGVVDFQEARALFECAIARHAARHATPKQLAALALTLADNRRDLGDAKAFVRSDMDFHRKLVEIPDNPIFTAMNDALSSWLQQQRLTGMQVKHSMQQALRDHERIYEAVAAHDPDAAEQAMAEHLGHVAQYYWKAAQPRAARRRTE